VQLGVADVRRLLELVSELAALNGPEPFPRSVVERLGDLIPFHEAVYFEQGATPVAVEAGEPFPPSMCEAMAQYSDQRPTATRRLTPADETVKLSDRISRRQLARLDFYQEAMRPIGVDDELMLLLPLAEPAVAGFSLIRGKRFTERDRVILDLLAPHLARRRARATAAQALVRADVDLTEREWDVLAWVAKGRTNKEIAAVLLVSPYTVRTHLENVFAKLGVHTRTAAVAQAFASNGN
jgi:DNA-binding CsgD family transcriptional regulator